jgi:phage baseplate assembly protein W
MLFSTKKGERRMNLRFGSDLWNLLFEFNDDNLNQIVESTVTRDMATWMPYVKVQNISVTNGASEINQHTVNIAVAFTVPSVGITTPQTIRFTMQQGHS